ncbi:MAG: cellulase family glycosylhydrolase, partial [Rubrobacteraceae bacterium]|nr:cellulase family glycosylhydrolase [Rubrobacteraceae bacterium]
AGAAAMLGLFPGQVRAHANLPPDVTDAITHHIYDGVHGWTNWLKKYGVRGYFCETSWPNDAAGPRLYPDGTSDLPQWTTLGDKIYSWLDDSDVWVTYWTAGVTSGDGLWKAYAPTDFSVPFADRVINRQLGQAPTIEAHPSTASYKRGVNANGGEMHLGMSDFSNQNLGVYGQNYAYPNRASLAYLASRGHKVIRLPFRWERVQPTLTPGSLGGPLNREEIVRLKTCVADAYAEGLKVILDPHNFGGYCFPEGVKKIGSAALPIAAFKDFWMRLSRQFKINPGIAGYQLMNEPRLMPGKALRWEGASRVAVNAIRANGDKKRLMVTGYFEREGIQGNGVFTFVANHPTAWIRDPLKKVFYTTHGYWGRYRNAWTYNDTNAYWESEGY